MVLEVLILFYPAHRDPIAGQGHLPKYLREIAIIGTLGRRVGDHSKL